MSTFPEDLQISSDHEIFSTTGKDFRVVQPCKGNFWAIVTLNGRALRVATGKNREKLLKKFYKPPVVPKEILQSVAAVPETPPEFSEQTLTEQEVGEVLADLHEAEVPEAGQLEEGFVDAAVIQFDSGYGNGMAEIVKKYRRRKRHFLMVDRRDVVTLGNLKVGATIRCKIGEPDPGYRVPRGRQIEIYLGE